MLATLSAKTVRAPYLVAVGASGGQGLRDLRELLQALPVGLAAVVMVVLHRPSNRISHLRQVLARRSALPVVVPKEAEMFRPSVCYLGDPASHLSLAARTRVHLIEGAGDKYRNCTVDLLFMSLAAHAGGRGIGVVLSGSLSDGARGLAAIHYAGGATMVLGAAHKAAAGMPSNATHYNGPIDFTGSIRQIADEIVRRVSMNEPLPRTA